jgi:hypothetical protein
VVARRTVFVGYHAFASGKKFIVLHNFICAFNCGQQGSEFYRFRKYSKIIKHIFLDGTSNFFVVEMTSKEGDSRKTYILRIASHLVSLNLVEEKLPNVSALHRFCDTDEQRLVVTRLDSVSSFDCRVLGEILLFSDCN